MSKDKLKHHEDILGISRELKYDENMAALRTLAAFLIVLVHYSGTYLVYYIKNTELLNFNFWVANFINGMCRISTPMFLFISGHFLLDVNKGAWNFYVKRFVSVIIPSLFATLFYVWYDSYFLDMDNHKIVNKLKSGYIFSHMWYMYMLIGLYAVTPWISFLLKKMNKNGQLACGFILLFAGVCLDGYYFFFEEGSYFKSGRIFLLWFLPYTGYFILGYAFKDMWFYLFKKRLLLIFIIILCCNVILNFMSHKYWNYGFYFYSRTSLLVAASSVVFYLLFRQIVITKPNFLSKLADYTLGIYLYHAGILDILNRKLFWRYKTGIFLIDMTFQYTAVLVFTLAFVWVVKKASNKIGIQL